MLTPGWQAPDELRTEGTAVPQEGHMRAARFAATTFKAPPNQLHQMSGESCQPTGKLASLLSKEAHDALLPRRWSLAAAAPLLAATCREAAGSG